MIVLTAPDYAIVGVVIVMLAIRVAGDINDVVSARRSHQALKKIARRHFTPKVTVLLRLSTVEDAKKALLQISALDYPVRLLVVIDSAKSPKASSKIRYFIKKQGLSSVRVVQQRKLSVIQAVKKYVSTELMVALPDTAEVYTSLYDEAIVLFGDKSIDAVQMVSDVRIGNSTMSGIEAMFVSLNRYLDRGVKESNPLFFGSGMAEGVVVRSKYIKQTTNKELRIVKTSKPAYSIAPSDTISVLRLHLEKSTMSALYMYALGLLSLGVVLFAVTGDIALALGTPLAIQAVTVWWSLDTRQSLADRVSLLLLTPFFAVIMYTVLIFHGASNMLFGVSKIKNFLPSRTAARTQ